MKKNLSIIFFTFFITTFVHSQCDQNSPNSLFPPSTFISFIGGIETGEEKLLAWDFCFAGTDKSPDGTITYYEYHLNHTAHYDTGKYDFDRFAITNDDTRFTYITNSGKNFLAYKDNLIKYGFQKESQETYGLYSYKLYLNGQKYYLNIDRDIAEGGTPNYKITIFN